MKPVALLSRAPLVLLAVVIGLTAARCTNEAYAQGNGDEATISRIVSEQEYLFRAMRVIPTTGRTRQLTTSYDLTVSKDSVAAWLPYFGRAYAAPIDPNKGGIQFVSTDFEYTTAATNDGWNITIKPGDAQDVQELFLSVFSNGNATLRVISINRQPISFSGYVMERGRK